MMFFMGRIEAGFFHNLDYYLENDPSYLREIAE